MEHSRYFISWIISYSLHLLLFCYLFLYISCFVFFQTVVKEAKIINHRWRYYGCFPSVTLSLLLSVGSCHTFPGQSSVGSYVHEMSSELSSECNMPNIHQSYTPHPSQILYPTYIHLRLSTQQHMFISDPATCSYYPWFLK